MLFGACFVVSKKQEACVLFVITFCLIFYSVCEEAGLCAVCFNCLFGICFVVSKNRKVCVMFVIFGVESSCTVCYFILCAEQQTACVLLIFLPCCFEEGVSSSKICCFNIL